MLRFDRDKYKYRNHKVFGATKEYLLEVILPALFYCSAAGIFTGFIISVYGYCANWLFKQSASIYTYVQTHLAFVPLLIICLVILGFLSAFLIKKVPEVRGSGIPRTEGILRGLLKFKWLRIIIGTVVGSFISFFAGLSLGNEGPSVQLGAASAEGANTIFRSKFAWRRYVSSGGAAAGIGVAFGAPITGIIFAIEEIQKQFNPLLLLSAVVTTLMATLTARLISPVFGYEVFYFGFVEYVQSIPFDKSWMLIIIAVIIGIAAVLFNALLLLKPLIKDGKYSPYGRVILTFLLSGMFGLILTDSIGSGYGLIKMAAEASLGWKMLLAYLAVKLLLIVIGFRSGATGGLFVPMLTLGALLGGLLGKLTMAMGLPAEYYTTIVMLCMVAFMGATIRTPFTALILLIETTHATSGFLSAAIVIFVACMVAEVCMRKPLYDKLLEGEVERYNKDRLLVYSTFDKVVEEGCFAENRYIRNVLWPNNSRITSIMRGDNNIVPDGTTLLTAGDILHISCKNYDVADTEAQLDGILTARTRRPHAEK